MAITRPNNYEQTPLQGEFEKPDVGGHKAVIMKVEEKQSSTGKDMIVVYLDFAQDDVQPNFFKKKFANDIREEKKWDNAGTKYILVNDNEGNCSKAFKTFCTCVENSNAGFSAWKGETFNADGFKGKKVGCVYGVETDWYNNKAIEKHSLRWFISLDKVAEAKIPEPTETKAYKERPQSTPSSVGDGFVNIPEGLDEELPFN